VPNQEKRQAKRIISAFGCQKHAVATEVVRVIPPQILRFADRAILQIVARTQTASETKDRGGVIAEYGLLIALVFLAAVAAVGLYGESVLALFRDNRDQFADATGTGGTGSSN